MTQTVRNATMTPATQRPGWRTGIARISSGGAAEAAPPGVMSAGCAVDLRVRDGAALDAPLDEDLVVRAVLHQVLHRVEDGLRHAVVLRQRDPVRRRPVRLAGELELAVRLLDDVCGHRRIGHAHLSPTAGNRQVRLVLIVEGGDLHAGLPGSLALLALGSRVGLLGRPVFDGDGLAAERGEAADARAAGRLHVE